MIGLNITDQLPKINKLRAHSDIVVDGLLGLGAARAPEGTILKAIKFINQASKKGIFVLSIDLPSGINPDSGDIYEKIYFKVSHTDLYDQIREKQAAATIKIIKKFLKKYPKIKAKKQKGKETFFKKRKKSDSKLDINKSIKEQFNLLRICNNNQWPAHLFYKNKKFIIKITSENIKNKI